MKLNTYLFLILILISLGILGFFIFRKPKKKQPTQTIYTKALNAIIQGETKVALKHLKDVVKQDTDHIDAYLQIGNILREEGNIQSAILYWFFGFTALMGSMRFKIAEFIYWLIENKNKIKK